MNCYYTSFESRQPARITPVTFTGGFRKRRANVSCASARPGEDLRHYDITSTVDPTATWRYLCGLRNDPTLPTLDTVFYMRFEAVGRRKKKRIPAFQPCKKTVSYLE